MWGLRSNPAVFVPPVLDGSRLAHSEIRLESESRVRARATVVVQPVAAKTTEAPSFSVVGALTLTGPYARILFRQTQRGEPDAGASPIVVDSALLPSNYRISIPERIVRCRLGVTPYLWLGFQDSLGHALTNPACLGRCGRGSVRIEPILNLPTRVTIWLNARDVSRHRGPVLDLSGGLSLREGLVLRMVLASGCNQLGGPAGSTEVAELPMLRPVEEIQVPSRMVAAGIGGSTWVSLMLRDWAGTGDGEMPVGRCVRLDLKGEAGERKKTPRRSNGQAGPGSGFASVLARN